MKRIGILTHNYPINSYERKDAGIFVFDFAQELSNLVNVFVFCNGFGDKEKNSSKVPVTWYKWSKSNQKFGNWSILSPLSVLKFVKLLFVGKKETLEFCKKNKIDFNLAVWALPSGLYTFYAKKMLNIPYAIWCLGSDVNKYLKIPVIKKIVKDALRNADIVFANSYDLVNKLEKILDKKVHLLPAVTETKIDRIELLKLDKNSFNFLYVGRLESVKGPDILVNSIKILSKKDAKFKVNILGGGTMKDKLLKMANKNRLDKFIEFLGWADKKTVLSYMKYSDCLIITSRSESFPLVMIEAAKMGLPIISVDVGDCKNIINKYKIGFVAKENSPKYISLMMYKAIKKGHNIRALHKMKLRKFASDFSVENTVSEFIKKIK